MRREAAWVYALRLLCWLGALALGAATAHARSPAPWVDMTCPAVLRTVQSLQDVAQDGWTPELADATDGASAVTTHRLASVQFTSGPLRDQAFLMPENASARGQHGRAVAARWVFSGTDTPYMVCQYHDTAVRLTRPVPGFYGRCEELRDKDSPLVTAQVRCKP